MFEQFFGVFFNGAQCRLLSFSSLTVGSMISTTSSSPFQYATSKPI